jgi:hypothetical protein
MSLSNPCGERKAAKPRRMTMGTSRPFTIDDALAKMTDAGGGGLH